LVQIKLALILSSASALEAAMIDPDSNNKSRLAGEAQRALVLAHRLCRASPTDGKRNKKHHLREL
jgi:hypothetical protein